MTDKTVYKILHQSQWDVLKTARHFTGSPDDVRDGFVHLSTASQLQGTLDKYYTQAQTEGEDIIIAAFDAGQLGGGLVYEISRGGEAFPHLYAVLPLDAMTAHWIVGMGANGRYNAAAIADEG